MMTYLQRIAGYCLTGLTTEHALFFIYGPGGNGKSVFLNLLVHILGDYASTRRWTRSPARSSAATRPSSRCSRARAWSPPRRPRKAAPGLKQGSRR
jgi:hypothetical protein